MSRASVSRDSKATLCFFRARAPSSGFVFCIRRDWPWSNYTIEKLLSSPVLNNSLNLVTDKKCSDSRRGTEKKLTNIFFWLIRHRRGFLSKDLVKCSNVQWNVLFSKKAEDVCAIISTKSWTGFFCISIWNMRHFYVISKENKQFFLQEMVNLVLHLDRTESEFLSLVAWNSSKPVAGRSHLVRYNPAALRPIKDLVTSNMHNLTFDFIVFSTCFLSLSCTQ